MNKQQQQSHKIRNTKSNIKSNPSKNETTIQATNKLWTKNILNSNQTRSAQQIQNSNNKWSTITKPSQLYNNNPTTSNIQITLMNKIVLKTK